jgi:hypothetical protein
LEANIGIITTSYGIQSSTTNTAATTTSGVTYFINYIQLHSSNPLDGKSVHRRATTTSGNTNEKCSHLVSIRYILRSYDHLQAEIYTSEINMYIFPPEDGRTTEICIG